MSKQASSKGNKSDMLVSSLAIPIAFVVAILIYMFILGSPSNFEDNDPANHPINTLGTVHKGGVIVPILITVLLVILFFSIERFVTISRAKGKGNVQSFILGLREMVNTGQLDKAMAECDRQRGSVAAVLKSGLVRYKQVETDSSMDKESKIVAIQKDLEEATTLELPMLSKNLVIISTCASIATLLGLIGTVIGMIRSFAAMSQAGAPDATALATGISEALINTFLGITGSAIAIIAYNYFSSKIDSLTYSIDEAGYSLVQTFSAKH